jgi:catechol 2,3-dioxygenase-like lactoylglutathione lyase family enzyme
MAGRIDHIIVSVNDYEPASRFYDWLLPQVGYSGGVHDYGTMRGWSAKSGSFWIKKADARFASDTFNKDRVGLCEIAFGGESRAQIDALAKEIEAQGGRILDPPREYDYVPGYYAVFFADPDGIKLEVVHMP